MIKVSSNFKIKDYRSLYRILNDRRKYTIISNNCLEEIDLYILDLDLGIEENKKTIKRVKEDKNFKGFFILIASKISKKIINSFSDYSILKIIEKIEDYRLYLRIFSEILIKYKQRVILQETKVAVLDDDKLQLALIENILNKNNIKNVDLFSSFKEFKQSMFEYDIYIIDMILPNIYGEEVINKIRRKKSKALIMAFSSVEKKDTITSVLYNGADDYLVKPIDPELFIAKLYSNFRYQFILNENAIKEEKLKKMAITDGLTNLYNHKYIVDKLEENIKKARFKKTPLSIIMIDIDNFKKINDTYGHVKGDIILKRVSKILKEDIKDTKIPGRYGGEEFLVVLPNICIEKASKIAEKLRIKIQNDKFSNMYFTASFGVYQYDNETLEEFINKADKLLYLAKEKGKNRVEYNIDDVSQIKISEKT